jgi:hypothetical protein
MRLQSFEKSVAVVEDLLSAGIRVWIKILGILAQGLHTLAHRAGDLALLAQERIYTRVEFLGLPDPKLVHLLRCHVGPGRKAQCRLIERLALGQPADAGLVHRLPPQLRQCLCLPVEGGVDLVRDDAGCPRAAVAGETELGRAGDERGRKDGLSGGGAAQPAHLLEGAVDEKVGRHDFQSGVVAQALGFLVEHLREGPQPGEVRFRILAVCDLVLAIKESRHFLLGARQLAHDVGAHKVAILKGRRAGERFGLKFDCVEIGTVAVLQTRAAERAQTLKARGVFELRRAGTLEGSVIELTACPDVLALVEAEVRQQLRVLGKALVHEDINERVEPCAGIRRLRRCGGRGC